MNRREVVQKLNLNICSSGLILDNNKLWNHDQKFKLINQVIDGDLHDFFDLVTDEELFKSLDATFDFIFVGEIFHMINLQTIIYNLEYAYQSLNEQGFICISISENNFKTAGTDYHKAVNRLEILNGYNTIDKIVYTDEDSCEWTLLKLQRVANKQIDEDTFLDAIKIGKVIAQVLNKGKNINKLKAGFIKEKSDLDADRFNLVYTNNQELTNLYFQNEIFDLNPQFTKEYLINLANLVFENKNALSQLDNIDTLIQGSFNIAFENYKKTAIINDQGYIALFAKAVEEVWKHSLKQKLNQKLISKFEGIKE